MSGVEKFNKRILIAPLDWGLGHATRCIPIIRKLRSMGCGVIIATAGAQEVLLRQEFPDATFIHLPGYGVLYGKSGVMLRLLRQIPVIRRHIFTEHAWLQTAIKEYGIQGVISDNRYGLYTSLVPCVLITHQLLLQLPSWAGLFRKAVQQLLYHHIEHFSECWVPDTGYEPSSLAGAMSHPDVLPNLAVRYLGWLSRFEPCGNAIRDRKGILVSISGPEPQRTIFEQKVLESAEAVTEKIWLVRGLPEAESFPAVPPHITVYNHVSSGVMQDLMIQCRLLISRSGYSTLMDAMVLDTPIACVPTPGQTEQEYLAKRLMEKEWAVCQNQEAFSLKTLAEKAAETRPAGASHMYQSHLDTVITEWLEKL